MMRIKHPFLLACALSLLSAPALAGIDHTNGCEEFGIVVFNNTGTDCVLEHYQLVKGHFIDLGTQSRILYANSSQTFYIGQSPLQGPSLTTTYSCGGKMVSFNSQQNYCFIQAGAIHGQVVSSDPGLSATFFGNEGGYATSTAGHINWTISSKY